MKAFRTQKRMQNSLVLLLLSNKEPFPCLFLFPLFTMYIKSDVRGVWLAMEGKLVTSQYFYNFTTNINLIFLHLPVTSKGGKQRHTGLWTLPHIQWGKKEGTILKCRRPAQYMWATWRLHSKGRFVGYKSVGGQF